MRKFSSKPDKKDKFYNIKVFGLIAGIITQADASREIVFKCEKYSKDYI